MEFKLPEKSTLQEAFRAAVNYLEARGIEDAAADVSLLMERAAGLRGTAYYMHRTEEMAAEDRQGFAETVTARGRRIPVQHILGEAWFYGRPFLVDSSVLIPRMDTEVLAEEALRYLKKGSRVLDLCTGSGCIVLTLVLEAGVKGTGSDISAAALRMAERNAEQLQAECSFVLSDLFDGIRGEYDMIVSNPPYIRTDQIPSLDTEVKDHDPLIALDGGPDGLAFYRRIAAEAGKHLAGGGRLVLEIGFDQGESVTRILKEYGWDKTEIIRDLGGHARVVHAVRP